VALAAEGSARFGNYVPRRMGCNLQLSKCAGLPTLNKLIMATKRISIKVVSDIICPWCLVGSRRLEIALGRAVKEGLLESRAEVQMQWFPFFLDPTLPIKGRDKLKSYQAKFGAERTAQILPYMTAVGSTGEVNTVTGPL